MITLGMLAALGRDEELALHVKAGIRNGLTPSRYPRSAASGRGLRGRAGREPGFCYAAQALPKSS